MASIEIKTMGTRGGAWSPQNEGQVFIRVDYDGTAEAAIAVDAFRGSGDNYARCERLSK